MSTTAARRARLLRLRTIEHRVAAVRMAAADAAHAAVVNISDRVATLRDGIIVPAGGYRGHDLQSLSELATRLDRARAGLQPSLASAREVRDARDAERIAARVAEERTSRVHDTATRREAADRELRAAARSPRFRKRVGAL